MTTTVTETGPFERLVTFQLTDDQITAGKAATARKLSQDMKLKGFRPGKAPLPVIEAAVGPARLRSEVIDDLVPPALSEILNDEELRPAVTPQLEALNDVDGGVEVEIKVTLWPEIDLPNYRDREVEVTSPVVTPEELDTQVERMLEQFATVEEANRPAASGDFVSVDVKATKDGDPVEGANAADLLYEVGSGLFVEGIDELLEGAEPGTVLNFEAPLPVGFGDRAGEQVGFEVIVNEVKERILPELDDAWVDENTEFETVEELKAELEERLAEAKLQSVSRQYAERALEHSRRSGGYPAAGGIGPVGDGRPPPSVRPSSRGQRADPRRLLPGFGNRSGAVPRRPPPTGGDVHTEPADSRGCSQRCGDRCHS